MTRDELIAALEAATGPDRDLDWKIARVARGNTDCRYTEHVDAAITLVPEGYWWTCGACKRECHASVGAEGIDTNPHAEGFGATTAIALCIAALQAGAAPCNT